MRLEKLSISLTKFRWDFTGKWGATSRAAGHVEWYTSCADIIITPVNGTLPDSPNYGTNLFRPDNSTYNTAPSLTEVTTASVRPYRDAKIAPYSYDHRKQVDMYGRSLVPTNTTCNGTMSLNNTRIPNHTNFLYPSAKFRHRILKV